MEHTFAGVGENCENGADDEDVHLEPKVRVEEVQASKNESRPEERCQIDGVAERTRPPEIKLV